MEKVTLLLGLEFQVPQEDGQVSVSRKLKYSSEADLCLRDTGLGDETVVETEREQADHLCQGKTEKSQLQNQLGKPARTALAAKEQREKGGHTE